MIGSIVVFFILIIAGGMMTVKNLEKQQTRAQAKGAPISNRNLQVQSWVMLALVVGFSALIAFTVG
jgi:TRAP-type C4-dicarboxylate transport system permease small subunit